MAWTIRWRIVASFGIVLAAMVMMGAVTYLGLARIRAETTVRRGGFPARPHSQHEHRQCAAGHARGRWNNSRFSRIRPADSACSRSCSRSAPTWTRRAAAYETTIFTSADRDLFERFKQARSDYSRVQDEILGAAPSQQPREVVAAVATRLVPEFERTKAAIDAVFAHNRTSADTSFQSITSSVNTAIVGRPRDFVTAVIFACLCGFTLLRAITRPLSTLTRVVDVMRKGDFTQRALVHRRDELGVLAEGFNRMTEELTALVGQVQKSGLQVTSSVTEIAATAREHQATATEIASTTTEIGATSKEISATSKELVKTMSATRPGGVRGIGHHQRPRPVSRPRHHEQPRRRSTHRRGDAAAGFRAGRPLRTARRPMTIAACEQLLKDSMGLDVATIGSSAIERAVRHRQQACQLPDVHAYWEHLRGSQTELQELIDAVVVPETWFFRDRESFAALERLTSDELLPASPTTPLRLLSVPCATGEEPYSIVMTLLDAGVPEERFRVEAIDICERLLIHARRGVYGRGSFRGADMQFRERHFQSASGGYLLNESVRRLVRFQQGNLLSPNFLPGLARYDVIFCRNVLIYFDRPTQDRALAVLSRLLTANGVVFAGPAESGVVIEHDFRSAKMPLAFAFRKAVTGAAAKEPIAPIKPYQAENDSAHPAPNVRGRACVPASVSTRIACVRVPAVAGCYRHPSPTKRAARRAR